MRSYRTSGGIYEIISELVEELNRTSGGIYEIISELVEEFIRSYQN